MYLRHENDFLLDTQFSTLSWSEVWVHTAAQACDIIILLNLTGTGRIIFELSIFYTLCRTTTDYTPTRRAICNQHADYNGILFLGLSVSRRGWSSIYIYTYMEYQCEGVCVCVCRVLFDATRRPIMVYT